MSGSDVGNGAMNALDGGSGGGFGGGLTPAALDANNRPYVTLTSGQSYGSGTSIPVSFLATSQTWVFKLSGNATGNMKMLLQVTTTLGTSSCSAGSSVVSNGSGTTWTILAGGNCRTQLTFPANTTSSPNFIFQDAAYAANSPKPILVPLQYETRYDNGEYWMDEYVNKLKGMNLKTLRDWSWQSQSSQFTNASDWANRTPLTASGWANDRWMPTLWAGSISYASSNGDQYTATCSSPCTVGSSAWQDGEVIQGSIGTASSANPTVSAAAAASSSSTATCNNATAGWVCLTVSSTTGVVTGQDVYIAGVNGTVEANGRQTVTVSDSTHLALQNVPFVNGFVGTGANVISLQYLTVTGKSGGAVPIATSSCSNSSSSGSLATANTTFVYIAALKVLCATAGGITFNVPLEAQAALANAVKTNLWVVLPVFSNANYASSAGALLASTLSPGLRAYCEWSNEMGFPGTNQYVAGFLSGQYLGIGVGLGYSSLRSRTLCSGSTGSMLSGWTGAGRSASDFVSTQMWQAFGDSTVTSNQLSGSLLSPTNNKNLCVFLGGTFSGTCSGAPDYSTVGNRSVDKANTGGYASYISGESYRGSQGYSGITASGISQLASIQSLTAAGSTAAANAIIDQDLRIGYGNIATVSSVSGTTINVTQTYSVNQTIAFTVSGGTLASWGLVPNKAYAVKTATGSQITIAASVGGTAISMTTGTGTLSVGNFISPGSTPSLLVLASQVYQNAGNFNSRPGWQGVAASFNGVGGRSANLRIESYEGGPEMVGPTVSVCTTMGLTTSATVTFNTTSGPGTQAVNWTSNGFQNNDRVSFSSSGTMPGGVNSGRDYLVKNVATNSLDLAGPIGTNGAQSVSPAPYFYGTTVITPSTTGSGTITGTVCRGLDSALENYKNDPLFAAFTTDSYNQLMGTDTNQPMTFGLMANSQTPSQFLLGGASQWSIGRVDAISTTYQSYNGIAAFVGKLNFLLKRDFDPASNDNSPMFSEKAA